MKKIPATTSKRQRPHITSRCRRLIQALRQGSLSRIEADLVVGTTNAPEYVRELRRTFGLSITTERVSSTDRDGQPTRTGVYHLDPGAEELADFLLSRDTSSTSTK